MARALAIDVVAYGVYYGMMSSQEHKMGVTVDDMEGYIDWIRN